MRIIFVRHGDPDYEHDTLTETGWREAELVAERIAKLDVNAFYVSPMGRAQDTAGCTLKKMHRTAETLAWLHEFQGQIYRPDISDRKMICWDWLPQDMAKNPEYYDVGRWAETEVMREGHVKEEYDRVCQEFDRLLAKHGYEQDGLYYRAVSPNHDTIVLFCHFGIECVMLSHLLHISPMILWHNFCAAPTAVTSLYTEERREGIAIFRMNEFGSTEHLYAVGEKPSFAARFCECYTDLSERHD